MTPHIALAPIATPADIAAAQDLMREYVFRLGRDHGISVAYQDFDGEMATFPDRYAFVLLARVDGAAAAVCGLKRIDAACCELKRLYCRDAFRGFGLGERLTRETMDRARALGFTRMVLDTHASFTAAIAVYERLGFVPSEPHNEPGNACTLFYGRDL
ncbi:MAG: GNAT family N-acetyltransferase [Alphaproteobacteria bacterium]|nr:GNAT family N-acetyltransferase [Alphaproteobacteria bacterium]